MIDSKKRWFVGLIFLYLGCSTALKEVASVPNTQSSSNFNFFVIGDWGKKGSEYQTAVAKTMVAQSKLWSPAFIVSTGDNFYLWGVDDVYDKHWQKSFEQPYEPLSKDLDWYIALGNHDYMGQVQAQLDYTKINPRWKLPQRYYYKVFTTKDGQSVRMIFIDTSPFVASYHTGFIRHHGIRNQDTTLQKKWLDETLAASTEDWRIVIGHHPIYSCDKHGDTKELHADVKKLLEKYKVHAYINGHSHNLQYSHRMGEFTHHIVSGAGAEAISVKPKNVTLFAKKALGFASLSIDKDSLKTTFLDVNGAIMYQKSRGKN